MHWQGLWKNTRPCQVFYNDDYHTKATIPPIVIKTYTVTLPGEGVL